MRGFMSRNEIYWGRKDSLHHKLIAEVEAELAQSGLQMGRIIRDALLEVRRDVFLPRSSIADAYDNKRRRVGTRGARYELEPALVAALVHEALLPRRGELVRQGRSLVVRPGHGYILGLLRYVGFEEVIGMDSDHGVASFADQVLARDDGVSMVYYGEEDGYIYRAPYEAIVVAGSLTEGDDQVKRNLQAQLTNDGVLVYFEALEDRSRFNRVQTIKATNCKGELWEQIIIRPSQPAPGLFE
jgi:protein-L-isoaspartate O-methyltransferase